MSRQEFHRMAEIAAYYRYLSSGGWERRQELCAAQRDDARRDDWFRGEREVAAQYVVA